MARWKTLKNADGKGGVRYREHPTRKHGAVPDRYYTLSYWWKKKSISEALGWASEQWTPSKCFEILAELKHNQTTGKVPCTLSEMREQSESEKETERKAQAAERQQTFKAFFDDIFLPDAKTRWKPQTTEKAIQHVKNWIDPTTGDIPMRELGLASINKIKANLSKIGRTPRMQQYVFRTFSMVWNAAFDHGFVNGPCPTKSTSFRLPKVDNERQRYLTIDEEITLLEKVMARSKQAHDMALVSLDAGLRFSEIASLTLGSVNIEKDSLQVLDSKGGDRIVPMTARLSVLFELMAPGKPSDLVFPNAKDQVHKEAPSAFRTAVLDAELNKGILNKKLRASFHTLRHTFASRQVQAGVDLYRVQRLLGHSTPMMTARYSKLADSDLRQAIQAMEQDKIIRQSNGKVIKLQKSAKQ